MSNILIFGDSITRGAFDFEKSGWAQRLNTWLWQKNFKNTGSYYHGPEAYIFAMDGDVVGDIIKRFECNIASMPWDKKHIIVAVGLNDSGFVNQEKRSSKKDFQKDVQILINRAKRIVNTENISFVGIADIDSKIIKTDFKQERVREFDNILEKVVLENDCNFISMHGLLLPDDLADGYHPNPQGHQKMFERIRDFLVEKGVV